MNWLDHWGHGTERDATAFHEAGHTVVGIHFGYTPHRVNILRENDGLGRTDGVMPSDTIFAEMEQIHIARRSGSAANAAAGSSETTKWLEAQVCSSLAGPLAEGLHRGALLPSDDIGSLEDRHSADFAAAFLWGPGERLERVRDLERRTLDLLQVPRVWRAVEAVARALLERNELSAAEASALYRNAVDVPSE